MRFSPYELLTPPSTLPGAIFAYPITQYLFGSLIIPTLSLSLYDRFLFSLKATSTLHSILTTLGALQILLLTDWSQKDFALTHHPKMMPLVGLELGYLLQDLVFEVKKVTVWQKKIDWTILLHHIGFIAGLIFFLGWVTTSNGIRGDFFIAMLMLMNASTPLLHTRWLLYKFPSSSLPKWLKPLTNIFLAIAFLGLRVFLIGYMFHLYGARKGISWWAALWEVPRHCRIVMLTIAGLNALWWMTLMSTMLRLKQKSN